MFGLGSPGSAAQVPIGILHDVVAFYKAGKGPRMVIIFNRGKSVLVHYDVEMSLKNNVDKDFFRAIAMA